MKNRPTIISLGGSLVVPDKINIKFLKKFKSLILGYTKRGDRFVLICGGGSTSRKYQEAARSIIKLKSEDIDWLGIHGTRLNAHLLRTIFYRIAHPRIIQNPLEKIEFKEKILIGMGWKPGFSTDYDSVLLAKNFKANKLINLTNTDYIYDRDPAKFKNAKPLREITWSEFRKLLPNKWSPGLHTPFDPVASQEAEKIGLEVAINNGKKLDSIKKYLDNKKFIGTLIK